MHIKTLKKAVSVLTLATFILTNSIYAAPESKSIFKNKKVDYQKISDKNENTIQQKKAILNGEDIKQAESEKKEAQRILSGHLSDISHIHIPSEIGRVVEVYQSPSKNNSRLIVHIQDLHTNPEATFNLAKILEILLKDYSLGLVCSEGADGEVDTSSVSSFPDSDVREKVAKLFVNSGELTGEEYLSITKYPDLPIWGIEDKDIYFKNIEDFNKIIKFNADSQVFISQTKKALGELKPRIYSKELMGIDQKETDYENQKIETADYLKHLSSYNQKLNIPTSSYKNITLLNETTLQESRINQQKIMQESQNLLMNLQSAISAGPSRSNDLDTLMAQANLFKDQKISPFSFYSYLKDLANKHLKDDLAVKYPDFTDFVDYLTKVNSLDSTKLFIEMEELAYDIKQRLARNEEEKTLTQALRNIKFLENFFNLKISNEELEYYLNNRDSHKVGFFEAFLKPAMKKYNVSSFVDFNPGLIDSHLQEIEDFYRIAKSRDLAMFNNTVSEVEKRNVKVASLITGGFHTKGLTKLLKENGYSYIVISPFAKTGIDEENYRFLLSGQRKPIEELIRQLELPSQSAANEISDNLRVPVAFDKDDQSSTAGRIESIESSFDNRGKVLTSNEGIVQTFAVPEQDLQNPVAFGTAGARESSKIFTPGFAARIVQAIATVAKARSAEKPLRIAVGYDSRPGHRDLAIIGTQVLAGNWIHVDFIDQVTPTPIMGEATRSGISDKEKYDYAVHFTASHNPVYTEVPEEGKAPEFWQGVKVLVKGIPAGDALTSQISKVANISELNKTYKSMQLDKIPSELTTNNIDLILRSKERQRKAFDFKSLSAKLAKYAQANPKFQIRIDTMNGATGEANSIFGELPIKVTRLNTEPLFKVLQDGRRSPILTDASNKLVSWAPDPTRSQNLDQTLAKKEPSEIHFYFDGDGDRFLCRDFDGSVMNPNELGVIFAHYLYEYKGERGDVVRTLPTTRGLDRFAAKRNLSVKETGVGSKNFEPYINTALVAVEESGHIFFRLNGEVFADSAIGEALLVLDIISTTGLTLKQYLSNIENEQGSLIYNRGAVDSKYVNPEFKESLLDLRENNPFLFSEQVESKLGKKLIRDARGALQNGQGYDTKDKTGILLRFENGSWAMFRVSGTENIVRIYGEEETKESLQKQESVVEDILIALSKRNQQRLASNESLARVVIDGDFVNDDMRQRLDKMVKVATVIAEDKENAESKAARTIADLIKSKNANGDKTIIGFATGGTYEGIYKKLLQITEEEDISWENVVTFNLDEYVWDNPEAAEKFYDSESYRSFMYNNLFNGAKKYGLKEDNIHLMDGLTNNPESETEIYEAAIMRETNGQGVDLQVLGIGVEGHIAFMEARPDMPLDDFLGLKTMVQELAESTIKANSRFFGDDINAVPTRAMTQGISTILKAKNILLVATGSGKAEAISKTVAGAVSAEVPASVLQVHKNTTIIVDQGAASGLIKSATSAGQKLASNNSLVNTGSINQLISKITSTLDDILLLESPAEGDTGLDLTETDFLELKSLIENSELPGNSPALAKVSGLIGRLKRLVAENQDFWGKLDRDSYTGVIVDPWRPSDAIMKIAEDIEQVLTDKKTPASVQQLASNAGISSREIQVDSLDNIIAVSAAAIDQYKNSVNASDSSL